MSEEPREMTEAERAAARWEREFGPDLSATPWKRRLIGFGAILVFFGIILWTVLAA